MTCFACDWRSRLAGLSRFPPASSRGYKNYHNMVAFLDALKSDNPLLRIRFSVAKGEDINMVANLCTSARANELVIQSRELKHDVTTVYAKTRIMGQMRFAAV